MPTVICGHSKQRIESIFRFMGLIRGDRFSTVSQITPDIEKETIDWKYLRKKKLQHRLTGYKL